MSYLPLSKFKYNNDGSGRKPPQEIEAEYRARLSWPSTVTTALYPALAEPGLLDDAAMQQRSLATAKYPIFFVETKEINFQLSRVQRLSAQIMALASSQGVPNVAIDQYLKSLLQNEIIFTNDIEGVQTDPREIGRIIGSLKKRPGKTERRLESTIRKYNDSISGRMRQITQLSDFRAIYDELLKGEIAADALPAGDRFRNKFAFIGSSTHAVHIPPATEDQIEVALEQLLVFMNDDAYISVEKAIITHFMFENTHPFADGNGRMGRYLLSSYLSSKLDPFTGLSVSTAIHRNLPTYYKLFQEADLLENRGELTFFIQGMLSIIEAGQRDVLDELQARRERLQAANVYLHSRGTALNEEQRQICYVLLQSQLFTENITYGIQDRQILDIFKQRGIPKARTKRNLAILEQRGLIETVSKNPLQHVIAENARTQLAQLADTSE
ncbi:Fic family protein [Lacticaseibacillus mingshuiensis]|uniref:Fic family protein n=1 Tax=Lacticaseibacillus mingshuiensis TaxID=2799574 RepID=UPI0019500805|nr:Fic family protein [Lacticaseibacillus mingshuiensis]